MLNILTSKQLSFQFFIILSDYFIMIRYDLFYLIIILAIFYFYVTDEGPKIMIKIEK